MIRRTLIALTVIALLGGGLRAADAPKPDRREFAEAGQSTLGIDTDIMIERLEHHFAADRTPKAELLPKTLTAADLRRGVGVGDDDWRLFIDKEPSRANHNFTVINRKDAGHRHEQDPHVYKVVGGKRVAHVGDWTAVTQLFVLSRQTTVFAQSDGSGGHHGWPMLVAAVSGGKFLIVEGLNSHSPRGWIGEAGGHALAELLRRDRTRAGMASYWHDESGELLTAAGKRLGGTARIAEMPKTLPEPLASAVQPRKLFDAKLAEDYPTLAKELGEIDVRLQRARDLEILLRLPAGSVFNAGTRQAAERLAKELDKELRSDLSRLVGEKAARLAAQPVLADTVRPNPKAELARRLALGGNDR